MRFYKLCVMTGRNAITQIIFFNISKLSSTAEFVVGSDVAKDSNFPCFFILRFLDEGKAICKSPESIKGFNFSNRIILCVHIDTAGYQLSHMSRGGRPFRAMLGHAR